MARDSGAVLQEALIEKYNLRGFLEMASAKLADDIQRVAGLHHLQGMPYLFEHDWVETILAGAGSPASSVEILEATCEQARGRDQSA